MALCSQQDDNSQIDKQCTAYIYIIELHTIKIIRSVVNKNYPEPIVWHTIPAIHMHPLYGEASVYHMTRKHTNDPLSSLPILQFGVENYAAMITATNLQ